MNGGAGRLPHIIGPIRKNALPMLLFLPLQHIQLASEGFAWPIAASQALLWTWPLEKLLLY